jgi:cytochrome c oxidase subunit 2
LSRLGWRVHGAVVASTQADFSRVFASYAWVLGGVFVLALLTMAVLLVRFRSGSDAGGKPPPATGNRLVEGGAIIVLALLATFLVARTFTVEGGEDSLAATPAVRVSVIAYQWGWEFDYPGTPIRIVGETGRVPTLVLPAGRTVQVSLSTRDVIHSFWVPALRYKRDAIPGVVGRFDIVVQPGEHRGTCSLFCGLHHAEMRFRVRGVDGATWTAFLKQRGSQ